MLAKVTKSCLLLLVFGPRWHVCMQDNMIEVYVYINIQPIQWTCFDISLKSSPFVSSRSSIVTLRRTTPRPITWILYSNPRSLPVASSLRKLCPPRHCPVQTALSMRPRILTAISASCLRWDQSGASINSGARVLSSKLPLIYVVCLVFLAGVPFLSLHLLLKGFHSLLTLLSGGRSWC